jgi:hypothetical protein
MITALFNAATYYNITPALTIEEMEEKYISLDEYQFQVMCCAALEFPLKVRPLWRDFKVIDESIAKRLPIIASGVINVEPYTEAVEAAKQLERKNINVFEDMTKGATHAWLIIDKKEENGKMWYKCVNVLYSTLWICQDDINLGPSILPVVTVERF